MQIGAKSLHIILLGLVLTSLNISSSPPVNTYLDSGNLTANDVDYWRIHNVAEGEAVLLNIQADTFPYRWESRITYSNLTLVNETYDYDTHIYEFIADKTDNYMLRLHATFSFNYTIESAHVVLIPGNHDIAVENITISRSVVGQNFTLLINTTIENQGGFTEIFNVTVYRNNTIITQTEVTLTSGNHTVITFSWNTTGVAKGNYNLSVYAWPVLGETDLADNRFADVWVRVAMLGDISGEPFGEGWGVINIYDVVMVTSHYGFVRGDANWDENADLSGEPNGDGWGVINIYDVVVVTSRYGQEDN